MANILWNPSVYFWNTPRKCIIVYKRAVDSKSTAYFSACPKLLTSGRTDRQTDRQTRCLKGDHSQKVMQRVEVQSQQKKSMRCRLHVKKYGKINLKHLLQFPDQPSPILGSTENTTFVHLPKKSKYLKADFF